MKINPNTLKDGVTNTFRYVTKLGDLDTMGVCPLFRSVRNFLVNLCSALTAYSFFDNKPEALPVHVERTAQLELF